MYCWRTAPTATSEASVMILVGASGLGCDSSVAVASASLMVINVAAASSFHCSVVARSLDEARRLLRECSMLAPLGIKRW